MAIFFGKSKNSEFNPYSLIDNRRSSSCSSISSLSDDLFASQQASCFFLRPKTSFKRLVQEELINGGDDHLIGSVKRKRRPFSSAALRRFAAFFISRFGNSRRKNAKAPH